MCTNDWRSCHISSFTLSSGTSACRLPLAISLVEAVSVSSGFVIRLMAMTHKTNIISTPNTTAMPANQRMLDNEEKTSSREQTSATDQSVDCNGR